MRAVPQKTLLLLALVPLLLAAVPGCKRNTGRSPHYVRGSEIYQRLYAQEIDDAFLDPKMDEAVAELKQVEATSTSYAVAQELLAQIEKGRKEAKAADEARQKDLAAARRAAPPPPPPPGAWAAPVRNDSDEPVDAGTDAGPAPDDPYGPGATIADINKASGGCLVPDRPFFEGKTVGASYKLAPSAGCQEKLPGFANQVVLAINGKVYKRLPAADLKAVQAPAGVELPAALTPEQQAQQAAQAQGKPAPKPAAGQPAAPPPSRPAYEGQQNATPLPESTAGQVDDVTPKGQ